MTDPDRLFTPGSILAAVPRRLRPGAELILGNRAGALLLRIASELFRVQIFDRSMTLAAQAFTSIFPILIMFGALFGHRARGELDRVLQVPDSSARLIDEALSGSRSGAFGVVGSLIVIVSATGLARALARSYRAIWSAPGRRGGPAATAWQIGAVLMLVFFLVAIRVLGWLTGMLPAPHVIGVLVTLLSDFVLAVMLPRILLGPGLPRNRLLVSAAVFGAAMVGVRAVGSVYLPRALQASADRYGTIGLAFTYIGWLYVISFCLLLCAVAGAVLTSSEKS
ncbi:YhjD/YihY/BrkB family envelope integrity protein [Actinoplanes missouriensis]|uniref:YhjD/YihY/BrkB family envelope integrity protein n=1 Tax=Actinoplanes missouriensis TaxID=1866 RepID=UPI001E5E49C9|nr:YhjD/YihY/BrkB family envelope integrity protein [Actinoplanes missouriensis]